jgi:hypothetical protein
MATYTYQQLSGTGSIGENFSSGVTKTFTFTNPSSSTYFVLETVRTSSGFYDENSPQNFSGSYTISGSLESGSLVSSPYITGFVVPGACTSFFTFTPANNVTGTTYYMLGGGEYSLTIS